MLCRYIVFSGLETCHSSSRIPLVNTEDLSLNYPEVPLSRCSLLIQLSKVEYKQQNSSVILSPSLNIINDDSTIHSPPTSVAQSQSSLTHFAASSSGKNFVISFMALQL